MRSAAREVCGATFAARGSTSRRSLERRRRPADEQSQRRIVRSLFLAFAERLWVDRVEHRPADWIDNRDHDFRATRDVEHDPVESPCRTGDADQITYLCGIHNSELTGRTTPEFATTLTAGREQLSNVVDSAMKND
jgi:hypothetical protein